MDTKVTRWNGRRVIIIEATELEPAKEELDLRSTNGWKKMLMALLFVAPVVSLVTYATDASIVSIAICIGVGLGYSIIGISSGRLPTIILTGIVGGVLAGIFALLWSSFKDFHDVLFGSYRDMLEANLHISEFLAALDSLILYALANFVLIGLAFGLGWGGFLGYFSALSGALAISQDESMRLKMFRGWRQDVKTWIWMCAGLGLIVGVIIEREYGASLSVCLGAALGTILGACVVAPIGGYCGANLRHTLGIGLKEFAARVMPRASKAWQPLIGFAIGYIVLVMLFASCYAAAYRVDPDPTAQFTRDLSEVQQFLQGLNYPVNKNDIIEQAEKEGAAESLRSTLQLLPSQKYETSAAARRALGEEKDLHFGNFLYFSIMTITSLGYSNVEPTSPFTQSLAAFEGILAFVWTAVIFAFLILDLELFYAQETGRQSADSRRE